jgi:hypothetical protein
MQMQMLRPYEGAKQRMLSTKTAGKTVGYKDVALHARQSENKRGAIELRGRPPTNGGEAGEKTMWRKMSDETMRAE